MNPDDATVNRSDARRAQIIAAARDLYEERGLSHTTVKDITERVGVTRTLFYHYFPDKDAVTSAVIDDYTQDYVEALANWNDERIEGDIDHALSTIVKLLRIGLFEDDTFHIALSSRENAALYLEFVNRVADETTRYIIDTTVRDYADLHDVRIDHLVRDVLRAHIGCHRISTQASGCRRCCHRRRNCADAPHG